MRVKVHVGSYECANLTMYLLFVYSIMGIGDSVSYGTIAAFKAHVSRR